MNNTYLRYLRPYFLFKLPFSTRKSCKQSDSRMLQYNVHRRNGIVIVANREMMEVSAARKALNNWVSYPCRLARNSQTVFLHSCHKMASCHPLNAVRNCIISIHFTCLCIFRGVHLEQYEVLQMSQVFLSCENLVGVISAIGEL